jgi:DNA uptake protein ComE-like DNA-binding protein
MEFVELLGIDLKVAEKILERKYAIGYVRTFDDLKDIEGMTDTILDKIKKSTFICTPNY